MLISLNYLKKFLNFDLPEVNELMDIVGSKLGALEGPVINLGQKYSGAIIAEIVNFMPIEGSDHLSLCLINDQMAYKDSKIRNSDGTIHVVCGASNLSKGQLVVWLSPGSILPSSSQEELIKIETKQILGTTSHGMLASARELMIDDDHQGILELDKEAKPGDSFAELYDLNDYIFEIENKMFTHRPDCFGLIGIAREIAGILNHPFKSPDWYLDAQPIDVNGGDIKIKVNNSIPDLVPRFSALGVANVDVRPSPLQIKSYLTRMGIRPVNNLVDITNLVMLETAQPLHAYDYDVLAKMAGSVEVEIGVRHTKKGDQIKLLDGRDIGPSEEAILITCHDQPIGIGGIMGGLETSVTSNSKNVVIESANFDMYSIRRSAMAMGIFTEAVTRFNKGQSPLQTVIALGRVAELLKESGIGSGNSVLVDDNHLPASIIQRNSVHTPFNVSTRFINQKLGLALDPVSMARLLENVEIKTELKNDELHLKTPFWRTDVEFNDDVVEEVGRLYGFNDIPLASPKRDIQPAEINALLAIKQKIRQVLSAAGADELLTYSFVSSRLMSGCNQDPLKAIELSNAISPEIKYYRLSLIPSLLSKVRLNHKSGYPELALFEIGKSHLASKGLEGSDNLGFVYSGEDSKTQAYFKSRAYLDYLLSKFKIEDIKYKKLSDASSDVPESFSEVIKPFDPNRSALVYLSNKLLGVVGEFSSSCTSNLKLPSTSSGFEISLETLSGFINSAIYQPISKYPLVRQDMTLSLANKHSYQELIDLLKTEMSQKVAKNGYFTIEAISSFKASDEITNYSFRVTLANYNQTLMSQEVNNLLDEIAGVASQQLGAKRI